MGCNQLFILGKPPRYMRCWPYQLAIKMEKRPNAATVKGEALAIVNYRAEYSRQSGTEWPSGN